MMPFFDRNGDFVQQPYPKLKKPYCLRWFHGPVTGTTGKGRDWAWLFDFCTHGDSKPECDGCDDIDCISRDGNRGFKFYSQQTESKVAHPYRDLFFNESGSYWMFDAKCCEDCEECTEKSCCSELFTSGRGFWTIQGALSTQDLKGHIRHYPDGTIEIHSATELVDYLAEATGARCIVTGPDSQADYSWQIKDFLTNAYVQALKANGKIEVVSPEEVLVQAPLITLDGNVVITGSLTVPTIEVGSCAHGTCSCDGSAVKVDSASGKCMMREPTGEWGCLGDKVLTSCCCQNKNNIVGCNSSGECWKWDGEEWSCLSTTPVISKIAIGCDGSLFGIRTSDGGVSEWTGAAWENCDGVVVSLAAFDSDLVYAAGTDHTTYGHLHRRSGDTWIHGTVGTWETFEEIDLGGGKIALKAANGKYVCAENGGDSTVVADSTSVRTWETFTKAAVAGGFYSLQAFDGHYVSFAYGTGERIVATADVVSDWEKFVIYSFGDGRIAIKAYSNRYWNVDTSDNLYALSDEFTDIDAVSVAPDGSVFAIKHSDGSLIKLGRGTDGSTEFGSSLGSATGLKQIAAKSGTMVWAVGSDDKLWYWNGLTWTKSSDDTVAAIALAMM